MNTLDMAPCPPDSDLMKAWADYQTTDGFKNSFAWVTVHQRGDSEPGSNTDITEIRDGWALGSMWAAFMTGFIAAGGKDPNR